MAVCENPNLVTEYILPITLEIELARAGDSSCTHTVVRVIKCHYFHWVNEAADGIDLFAVVGGQLRRFASYNGVLSAVEIEAENSHG